MNPLLAQAPDVTQIGAFGEAVVVLSTTEAALFETNQVVSHG